MGKGGGEGEGILSHETGAQVHTIKLQVRCDSPHSTHPPMKPPQQIPPPPQKKKEIKST